jgi:DNA-binding GntR family transcriptional regulator
MGGLNKQTYCEQVVDFIRAKILAGELPPLSPVKEVAIADELSSAGRRCARPCRFWCARDSSKAIRRSVNMSGALTAKQIRNSYFTGGVLEAAAVAAVVECYSDEDIAALESIVARMLAVARQSGSVAEQAPLDDAFHDLLFTRVDNELVVELCKRSCQGISKFLLFKHWVKLFPAQMVYERHLEIVTAIKSRDQALVESVIRAHYISSGEKMAAFGVDVYCAAA